MKFLKIDNSYTRRSCPLCFSRNIRQIGPIDYCKSFCSHEIKLMKQPEYWRCLDCQSTFNCNPISEDLTKKFYTEAEENYWKAEKLEDNKTKQLIDKLGEYLRAGQSVLDIGCNSGELLDFAKKFSCKTFGAEYSVKQRQECQNKGHKVFYSIDDIEEGMKFDIIFAFDLVEHLYSLPEFIKKCGCLLKKNGRLIILTANPNSLSAKLSKNHWWYIVFPEHIVFPSLKYFQSFKKWRLLEYFPVFNSQNYEKKYFLSFRDASFSDIFKKMCSIFRHNYNGHPSIDKDHVLVVLECLQ